MFIVTKYPYYTFPMEAFENSLKLTKISLFLSGINIYSSKWNAFASFIFYFNLLWLYVDVLGEFYWFVEGIQKGKSFGELTLVAPCATICLLGTAKSVPLFINRHLLTNTKNKLREIHPTFAVDDTANNDNDITKKVYEETNTKENNCREAEKKIVKNCTKFMNIVINFLYYSDCVVVVLFSTLPLMSMAYEYYKTKEMELKLPFLIKYFFDPFTMKTWPFVYFHQVWSTFIAAFNVFGADTFLYAFCSYVQMHFQLLCYNFEMMDLESSNPKDILVPLVKRHQELIKLVSDVEILYSKSTLFNIITSSVLICLSGFNVTVSDDSTKVCAFLSFLIMNICQISMLCLFGDKLMSSSMQVSEAVYKCRWYQADQGTRRSLLVVMRRAQKPCKLTAAKFADLKLTAFTTILSRSWSLFALLQTMYHK